MYPIERSALRMLIALIIINLTRFMSQHQHWYLFSFSLYENSNVPADRRKLNEVLENSAARQRWCFNVSCGNVFLAVCCNRESMEKRTWWWLRHCFALLVISLSVEHVFCIKLLQQIIEETFIIDYQIQFLNAFNHF